MQSAVDSVIGLPSRSISAPRMLGLVTPPVGLCLYVVSSISQVSLAEISAELWPYLLALVAVLLLITFVPELSLWLPHVLGYGVIQ